MGLFANRSEQARVYEKLPISANMPELAVKCKLYQLLLPLLSEAELSNWNEYFSINYTHDSTSIEGNSFSLLETSSLLVDGILPGRCVDVHEADEIRGHDQAWNYVKSELKRQRAISEEFIKDIHEKVIFMPGVGGIYRTSAVFIRGAQHVPPNYKKVRDLMRFFIDDLYSKHFASGTERAAWLHAELVKTHPFLDGNGRTARLLMNYALMQNDVIPISIPKEEKMAYFAALEEYAMHDNLLPFVSVVEMKVNEFCDKFIDAYSSHLDVQKLRAEDTELYNAALQYLT